MFNAIAKKLGRAKWRLAKPHAQAILNGLRMVAVDVGAANGLPPPWLTLRDAVYFVCFEPHPESAERLRGILGGLLEPGTFVVQEVGLSGEGGERTLYMTNVPTGSSILPLNEHSPLVSLEDPYHFPIRELQIQTQTLHQVFESLSEERLDMIKLDIQGAELEVLRGMGSDRLDRILSVEVEVGLHGNHIGETNLTDVIGDMALHGLEVFDIRVSRAWPLRGKKADGYQLDVFKTHETAKGVAARVAELDVVFFRSMRTLLDAGDADQIRRQLCIYCAYNFFAEAYQLIELAEPLGIFSASDIASLKASVYGWWHTLHYAWWKKNTPMLNKARNIARMLHIGQRWSQYQWVDFPNS